MSLSSGTYQREPFAALVVVLQFWSAAHLSRNDQAIRTSAFGSRSRDRGSLLSRTVLHGYQRRISDRDAELCWQRPRLDAHRRPRRVSGEREHRIQNEFLHGG